MELSEKQLETITELASKFFNYSQCAIAIDADINEFRKQVNMQQSAAFKAYQKGFIQSELKVRDSILELAVRGSSPAQAQLLKIIERSLADNA